MSGDNINLVWLSGSYFSRTKTFKKIVSKFSDYEIVSFDSNCEPIDILLAVKTIDCFAVGRIIHILDFPKFSNPKDRQKFAKELKSSIKFINNNILIIFNGADKALYKTLHSHVGDIGKVFDFPLRLNNNDAKSWIEQRVSETGRTIDDEARNYIVNYCGFDKSINSINVDLLEMSIRKISAFTKNENIVKDDVISIAVNYENIILWDFMDALDSKDLDKCINVVDKFLMYSSDKKSSLCQLINTCMWKYRLVLNLKESILMGSKKIEAQSFASKFTKKSFEGSGFNSKSISSGNEKKEQSWSDGAIKMALFGAYGKDSSVDSLSRKDIYRIVGYLQDAVVIDRFNKSFELSYSFLIIMILSSCNYIDDNCLCRFKKSLLSITEVFDLA